MGLPVPYYNKGYLYYDNLGWVGNREYWDFVDRYAKSQGYKESIVNGEMDIEQIANALETQGRAELAKENKVLQEFFGCDETLLPETTNLKDMDFSRYLQAINDSFGIRKVWQRVVNNWNNKESGYGDAIGKLFGSYYQRAVGEVLDEVHEKVISGLIELGGNLDGKSAKGAEEYLVEQYNKAIDRATNLAWNRMLNAKASNKADEEDRPYAELLEALQKTENFRETFKIRFFNRLGYNNVATEIFKEIRDTRQTATGEKGEVTKQTRKKIRSHFTAMLDHGVGGLVVEEMSRLMAQYFNDKKLNGMDGFSFTLGTKKTKDSGHIEYSNTDSVMVFGGTMDFVTEFDFDTKMGLKERARVMATEFSKQVSENIDHGFIIYESTKAYTLKSDTEFRGTSYDYKGFKALLRDLSFPAYSRFLTTLMNTVPGTIFANDSKEIQDNATKSLSIAVAAMLFDDYKTIGNAVGDVNSIHVFRLTEIVVPLSYLLLGMAKAMRSTLDDLRKYVKINFTLGERLFSNSQYERGELETSFEASKARWEDQLQHALSSFNVSINFLSNFTDLLENELRS